MRIMPTLALALLASAPLTAQGYTTGVVGRNLNRPHGVAAGTNGMVYFTEIPNPGQSGPGNSVSVLDPTNGMTMLLVGGEPAPTNIAAIANGDIYWTCATAGVIFRRTAAGQQILIGRGLANPIGITATDAGVVTFTQVPTPGVPGSMNGRNTVSMFTPAGVVDVSMGEPEPVDVVTDAAGNLYWTCRTAGVILRRDATSQMTSPVFMGDLNAPTGIAMDTAGALYFTELPTPGMPGSMGGRNAVWKWDAATDNLTLIDFGDPDPVDITVTRDGSKVYWSCRTAGVIVESLAPAAPATIRRTGTTRPGDTFALAFSSPADANLGYRAAASFGRGPIAIDTRWIPLAFDGLFIATAENRLAGVANGFAGTLDGSGNATGSVRLPSSNALVGLTFYTSFVTLDPNAPSGVQSIASANRVIIG